MTLLKALVLTVVIEGTVMFFLTKSPKWIWHNLVCNLLTNPLLNLTLTGIAYLSRDIADSRMKFLFLYCLPLVLLEAAVFWGEGKLYGLMTGEAKKICVKRSVITNSVSFGAGLLLTLIG